jgi:hypothetical protein
MSIRHTLDRILHEPAPGTRRIGTDAGRFVVPDDVDALLPPEVLAAFA